MKVRVIAAILATGCVAVAAVSEASAQQAGQQNCGTQINYDDADIRAVVDEIAMRTGRTFLLDPRVAGRVTIKSPPNGQLCADEAWELFQAMLRVNGYVATPVGTGKYKIVPVQEGPRAAGPVGEGASGDIVTEIVRLKFVDAREAAANISQITNERGVVAPVRSSNSVIIVDTADNVRRLRQVLAQLDRDPTIYRTIPLNNASAAEVARVVSGLAQEISEDGGQRAQVSVVPVEASNSVLVRAEPALMSRLESVIAELDRIGGTKSDLSVIYLNNTDAEEMAPLLREVANAQSQTGDGQTVASSNRAAISFHKPTNAIIINGDADIQRTLQNVIAKLDLRRAQVLVEAIIVEVSDNTARELGIQYFTSGTGGSKVPFSMTNFQSTQPNILAAAGALLLEGRGLGDDDSNNNDDDNSDDDNGGNNPPTISGALTNAAINSFLGINGFAFGGAGKTRDGTIFGAILTAIKQDSTSNVLSTPSIVTLDNQEAKLSVGQEIPITTGEAVGDNFANAFRTVSRENVGVILTVTPQINDGGTVTLKITQETSSVAGQIISSSTDLITNKREITTTALVDDGDILVIGGLIDEQSFNSSDKVPFLGDIPIAGNLFRSSARSKERRNLMVFIRPTILRDRETGLAATQKKIDYLKAREMLNRGAPQSDLERLIEQATGLSGAPPSFSGQDQ
ncbi:MAG: type II secretion system secretin GspD [Pseudomonadota bacterium]|nr:type II secretion system secretin GspD [Pseudomonadota bacterium]